MQKRIVVMPRPLDERWKSWAKRLTGVNRDASNGYAFEGEFLPLSTRKFETRRELNLGDLILFYSEDGSRKYHIPVVMLYRVAAEGDPNDDDGDGLVLLYERECRGRTGWALEVRDAIAKIVDESNSNRSNRREQLLARREELLAELEAIDAEIEQIGGAS